ncbi:glycerophosphodiester phosphodiesterase family protein [Albibacterium bauzanense]|uniref:Glycerophosphoryl diester phosphodiesterase n=1 Tax=Albibacterium bauzanense TaxID=653929 RepID=A0A4R1M7P6_9SPHI|nr:glycerophosphodiester phosphodiesterase family protein [Albibacterium bauzanense]TCK85869.1 glycerophosphoryl diester phosphodiesterase [Albibacterium bauzanense]
MIFSRLKGVFIVFSLVVFATKPTVQAQSSRVDTILEVYNHEPQTILVASHRGGHKDFPENSLAAIDEAIRVGAHIVELDVRETKDGELVIMHDKTVDRTTTGTGAIDSYLYSDLQKLFLTRNGQATSSYVPTLKEALLRTKGNILIDIDFKAESFETAKRVYELISELEMDEQVLFFLYDYKQMPQLYRLNPLIKIMPRAYNMEDLEGIVKMNMTKIIHIDNSFINNEKELNKLRSQGIRFWANTLGDVDKAAVTDLQHYQNFFNKMKSVSVVQTDEPELAVQYLKNQEGTH